MPTEQVEVVPLVRSRSGRGQRGFGFFLAGAIMTACAAHPGRAADTGPAATPATRASQCDPPVVRSRADPQHLPFGMFSADPSTFADLAHNGFTMVGPWYVPAPDRALLDAAAAAGLDVVFPIGDPQGRETGAFARTAEQVRAMVDARVREVVGHPAIVAWYVLPEEVRSWEAAELDYLRTASSAIRAADPRGRPVLSYQPSHHAARELAPVVAHVDIATTGLYVNHTGHRDARAWVRWGVDQLEAAGDAPVWLLPEMFEDPRSATRPTIAAWVRHDVYAGLVAGARGVLVYSGFRRQGFTHYDDYLVAYQAVARELAGPRGLGDVLLHGAACRGTVITPVDGAHEASFATLAGTERLPALAQLERAYAGARWLWLVNSSDAAMTVRVAAWTSAEVASSSAGVRHAGDQVRLPAWGVVVLRREDPPPAH
jgi:hypothetical protein